MRLIRFLALLVLIAVPAWSETRVVHSPGDGFLNLRTGPGSQFDIIIQMDHGTLIEIFEVAGGWGRVQHQTGAEGWAFLKHTKGFAPNRLYVHSPGDGFLNLRTGPGTQYAIVTRMNNGEWVEILERQGNWVRVFHEYGDEGWTSAKYLRP